MSQQSNPATLREALTAIIADLRRREKRNLNSAHASLRGFAEAAGYAADQLEKVAALAASGTEAAPRDVSERTLPGTCNYPFVAAGSKELGIELMITDRCELLHGHAGRHKNGNASWGQPAQAAAGPEGEGREALLKLRSYNVDILAGRINYRPQDHIDVIDAALRQSAAPSGAVQILRGQLYEHMEHCDNCIWERPCTRKRELDAARLAQESKTGAVTETK